MLHYSCIFPFSPQSFETIKIPTRPRFRWDYLIMVGGDQKIFQNPEIIQPTPTRLTMFAFSAIIYTKFLKPSYPSCFSIPSWPTNPHLSLTYKPRYHFSLEDFPGLPSLVGCLYYMNAKYTPLIFLTPCYLLC